MRPSQLTCRLNRSDIGTHLFGRAPAPALTLYGQIPLELLYRRALLSLIGLALAARPDFGRQPPHETHHILTSANLGLSPAHRGRRAEACGHVDSLDRLRLHVQDDLMPPLLTWLRLESLEPIASLDERRVLVPGLPGRTCVPGADDDPLVQAGQGYEELSADEAWLLPGRLQPFPHDGVPLRLGAVLQGDVRHDRHHEWIPPCLQAYPMLLVPVGARNAKVPVFPSIL